MEATKSVSFMMQPELKAKTGEGIGFVNLFNFMTCDLHLQCYLDINVAGFSIMLSFEQLICY